MRSFRTTAVNDYGLNANRLQSCLLTHYFNDPSIESLSTNQLKKYLNPDSKIKEPKVWKRNFKFLTEREIEHLRKTCKTPMENKLFEFMFSTGWCIGELISLDWLI